jgi:hypothetical protein
MNIVAGFEEAFSARANWQPQLLRPDSGSLQRPHRSLANSDEALAVANAIDEDQ